MMNLLTRLLDVFGQPETEKSIPNRIVNPLYILNEINRKEYSEKGYTVVKAVVPDAAIKHILSVHEDISKMEGYFESDKLETSIAFGPRIHEIVIEAVKKVSVDIFDKILDPNRCDYDFGGGIIIKNKGCWFAPHQDCSIVDEYKGTTTYAWIPTVDMNEDNGTFYAIQGSHLWAAWQRSSQYPSWPLKKFSKLLWDRMEPIFIDKGDVLLFDSALIHASGENKTAVKRIAFNVCIIEKDAQHVQYVNDKKTPYGQVEKFLVDLEYWYKGQLWGRPKGYTRIVEDTIYPRRLTEKYVETLINKYR